MGTVQCLRFEVLDAGVGLSDEAMQTLFNPFKQAQRLAGGTGLGLFSLAKRVEALHGQYGVSKRPDGAQGSLFWFTIPYRPDEESAKMLNAAVSECAEVMDTAGGMVGREATVRLSLPEKASIPENPCPAPRPNPGLSVMIVDDAPLVVKMTTLLLHQKGHRVIGTAMNGAEALDRILGGYDEVTGTPPYDVVLMDLQMPVLDGIEATKRLRGKEQIMEAHIEDWKDQPSSMHDKEVAAGAVAGALLPPELVRASPRKLAPHSAFLRQRRRRMSYHQFVIALSANSDHETKQEAFAAGADAFLAKPFTYDAFWETVDTSKSE
jgi:CheY-like chemotaxis protein